MNRFSGKTVIVTGGGTGIGAAIAEQFAQQGAQVLISGRRAAPLAALSERYPANMCAVQADVTVAQDRENIIHTALERYGRLDVLVNNAGYAPIGNFQSLSDQDFTETYATNLVAPAALIRLALSHLTASRGNVVNISTAAVNGAVPGASPYLCSKAALNQLTRVLAAELGPQGIRVNSVAPGATDTELSKEIITAWGAQTMIGLTPLGRLGVPADIAATVLFLASAEAAWVTGQIVDVSGGFML